MYVPEHFEEHRGAEIQRIIEQHPFGTLIVNGPAGLDAVHVPFDFDARAGAQGALRAHVARANPMWRESQDGDAVLVVFQGAHSYVSPNWYPSKHQFHRQVPTWNYQVVHVHGRIHIHDDEHFVRGVVARLTRTHEARADVPKPWKMGDSEPAYIDRMIAAVVGIEVEIERIVAASKLSQNKVEGDRANAASELAGRGHGELAEAMRNAVIKQPT